MRFSPFPFTKAGSRYGNDPLHSTPSSDVTFNPLIHTLSSDPHPTGISTGMQTILTFSFILPVS